VVRYVVSMRGNDEQQEPIFSYLSLAERIPADHPLRAMRAMVDAALRELDLHFAALYARRGRPSIPPEHLVRALLLMILHSIRGERQLMEHIRYNLAYRWFVGLGMDEAVWDATVFTKNRERLMQGAVTERLFAAVLGQARERGLLSEEHFTVDGTLIRAWAHRDSFHAKDEPPSPGQGSGHGGEVLLRDTHESSTDGEARLYKKSTAAPALPSYLGHVVTENRNGLVVGVCATQSSTTAEREACLSMLDGMGREAGAITLGADKQYQDPTFIGQLRQRGVVPHVAEYESGRNVCKNSLLAEERNSEGFRVSQQKRKLVEKVFGWCKLDRVLRQVKLRGLRKVDWLLRLVMTAQNLRRMVSLIYAQ
jgi:transposase